MGEPKTNQPIFSIIVPTFNRSDLLQEALESIQSQTFTAWEAIVVDNYSTDATPQVIAEFQDARVKTFKFHNGGIIAAARNYAIQQSLGQYIAFLDSDDLWLPRKLEVTKKYIDEKNPDILSHAVIYFQGERDIRTHTPPFGDCHGAAAARALLIHGNGLVTSSVVVRAELLRKVGLFCTDKEIMTAEDWDFWLRLAESDATLVNISEVLGKYRSHPEGMSKHLRLRTAAANSVIDRHLRDRPALYQDMRRDIQSRRALIYFNAAKDALDSGNRVELNYFLKKTFASSPLMLRTFILWATVLVSMKLGKFLMQQSLRLRGFNVY